MALSRSKNVRQRPEQLVAAAGRGLAGAQQREHGRHDRGSFRLVGDVRGDHLGDLGAGRLHVVGLEQAGARPDHLAERPERDPFAVGRRAAVVPPDALDHPVDVLQELPGEPALADPGLAGDRDEADAALAGGGVEQVLEQAQLRIAADERRLEPIRAAQALALAHDPQRDPGGDRRLLALEDLVAGRLEGDRAGGGPMCRLADEHPAGRGDGLESRRRVDQVAGDHPLVAGAEGDRGFAGQDAGPGLDAGRERADRVDQLERRPERPARRRPRERPERPRRPSRRRR